MFFGDVVVMLGIYGCWYNNDVFIVLAGKIGEVLVSNINHRGPRTNTICFFRVFKPGDPWIRRVVNPNSIIKIIDDPFFCNMSNPPFNDGWANWASLSMNHNKVIAPQRKQTKKATQKPYQCGPYLK